MRIKGENVSFFTRKFGAGSKWRRGGSRIYLNGD